MQKRASFTVRKSPRLVQQKISPNQESKPSNTQVCTSSTKKNRLTSSSTPSSVISKVNFKKTQRKMNPRNVTKDSVKLIDGSSRSDNGLRKSCRKIDGVEGFQSHRKSPRFADKEVSVVDDKKRDLGEIKNRSRVLGEIVNLMEKRVEKEKGNGNGGIGETRQKRKCIRGGKENLDSRKVQKRNNGTGLRSPFSSSENIYKKSSNEESDEKTKRVEEVQCIRRSSRISNVESMHVFAESSEKVEKKSVKSAKSRTHRDDEVEKVQGNRRSSRISRLDVFVGSSEKIDKRMVKSARTERVDKVEKVQGSRQSPRISNLEIVHVYASSECSDSEISPAAMPNVASGEKLERKLVKSVKSRTERVEDLRRSSRITDLETTRVYFPNECSDTDVLTPAVRPNVVSGEKLERKLVKSVKSRTERVEEVEDLRRSSRITDLETTRVYFPNECSDTNVLPPAVMRNVEIKGKRIVEDGRVKEKNPAEEKIDAHGWTKDQDAALHRAYFAVKPSPNFWKKVSRMVPGKTAQDCFDKIHSQLITPPQVQPRSRAKKTISSPVSHFTLSGSKLLEPTLNVRWPKSNKQKKLRAQKTLRHLVQKRSMADQGYEADLFSVLEPIMNAPTQDFSQTELLSTPESKSNKKGYIQQCQENLSVRKNPLSRFRNSCETALVSPPVLKQVKNRALHEKYIDTLHCRDARRTAGPTKCNVSMEDRKESIAKKMSDITVARNALVFEASNMISKFQEAQANIATDYDDSQDGDACDGEEDEEDCESGDVFSVAF